MKTNLESITWKGGRGRFENLVKSSQLKRGHIYFVGDYSGSELGGLEQSKSGVIYVATSERSYVTFGTFDLKNLEKRITEIEQRLEELGGNIDELIKDFATKVQTFTQASTRANIESGETISTIFGKIRKWFADLKAVAFSGSYDDLSNKPTIGSLAKLEPNSSEESFADTQRIIASPSNGVWGGTSYSKTALMMWNYINSKIGSVLGLTASSYNGTSKRLYSLSKERNNNKEYMLLGTYSIANSVYWEGGFSLYVQGAHNSNKRRTYLINVGIYTNGNSYATVYITYAQSNFNTSFPVVGEIFDNKLYLYIRNASNVYSSYIVSLFNDYKKIFIFETDNKYYDTPTPNGGRSCKIISTILNINDSNLSEYYNENSGSVFETLTIPIEVETIVFNTSNKVKISAIQIPDVFNGKRIALVGNYIPSESYAHTTISGRFSQYLYEHRYGSHGSGDSNAPVEFYEDFIYFNGIWFGKGY